MHRHLAAAVVCAVCLSWFALPAAGAGHPATLTPEGGVPLPLAAQARRVHLLGGLDVYTLAVYGGTPAVDRAHLASPDVAKALRIEIMYQEDIRRRVVLDWRSELVPPVEPAAGAHLRSSFASLRPGDAVVIEYVPAKGTAVRVNKAVVVSGAGHELMLAFLDHWIGQRPLSEEIKHVLLGSSSPAPEHR